MTISTYRHVGHVAPSISVFKPSGEVVRYLYKWNLWDSRWGFYGEPDRPVFYGNGMHGPVPPEAG